MATHEESVKIGRPSGKSAYNFEEITDYLTTKSYPSWCRGDRGAKVNFRNKAANFKISNAELMYIHKLSRKSDQDQDHSITNYGTIQNVATGDNHKDDMTATAGVDESHIKQNQLQAIANKTRKWFEEWNQGMVLTRATKTVLDKIAEGRKWITITGSPGEGKTTSGYLILEHLHKEGKQVYHIETPEDYQNTKGVKSAVLMLDDIFGSLHFDVDKYRRWEDVLRDALAMREHKQQVRYKKKGKSGNKGKVKATIHRHQRHEQLLENSGGELNEKEDDPTVIFICRLNILKASEPHLGRFRDQVMSPDSVVNYTTGVPLAMSEKMRIWQHYSEVYGIKIGEDELRTICQMSTTHGFPHCCRLYAAMYSSSGRSVTDFFSSPLVFLNQTMKAMINSNEEGPFLREMIKHDGYLNLNRITDDHIRFNYCSIAKRLTGTYLSNTSGIVTFSNSSIYESASVVISYTDPLFVVKYCSLTLLEARVILKGLNCGLDVDIQEKVVIDTVYYNVFLQRMKEEFAKRNLSRLLSNTAFHDENFALKFLKEIIIPGLEIAKAILKIISTKDGETGESFLFLMTKSGSSHILKYVCEHVLLSKKQKKEILHGICAHNSVKSLQYFLRKYEGFDLNVFNDKGKTLLHEAVNSGLIEIVKMLVTGGADVKLKSLEGGPPLQGAVEDGCIDIVKLLLDNGAEVDIQDLKGNTLLHEACAQGDRKLIKLLLDNEADVDIQNKDGNTPLHDACRAGDEDIVKCLLDKGANVNSQNVEGNTPLHVYLVYQHSDRETVESLLDREIMKCKNCDGVTPLHMACEYLGREIVKKMINSENIGCQNNNQETPMDIACKCGNKDIVKLLVEKRSEFTCLDGVEETPLKIAWANEDMRVDVNFHEGVVKRDRVVENTRVKQLQNKLEQIKERMTERYQKWLEQRQEKIAQEIEWKEQERKRELTWKKENQEMKTIQHYVTEEIRGLDKVIESRRNIREIDRENQFEKSIHGNYEQELKKKMRWEKAREIRESKARVAIIDQQESKREQGRELEKQQKQQTQNSNQREMVRF